jgi:dinuclear metal center YbgI/SA1388 family protein
MHNTAVIAVPPDHRLFAATDPAQAPKDRGRWNNPLQILPENVIADSGRNAPLDTHRKNTVCLEEFAGLLEKIAPAHLAEQWDNCGLQVGSPKWKIKKIWIALDPLISVMEAAVRHHVDLVITHHPLIFKPIQYIDLETPIGKVIATAIENRTAVYAAHTNLDIAAGGVNDSLAEKIGLQQLIPMVETQTGAGGDAPDGDTVVGIGRIGVLDPPRPMRQWIDEMKSRLGLQKVRVAGNYDQIINRAAVCSGSGGSLLGPFLNSDAQVYISGDLRYHDARAVEDAGRAFIDIGHFASEHIILETLVNKLTLAVEKMGWHVQIESCMLEKDPFELI